MRRIALWTVVLAAAGCQPVESTDIKTSGVYADIWVEADGSGETDVGTTLRVGGALSNTFLELQAGDELWATDGFASKQMSELFLLGYVSYFASFAGDAEDTEYVVSFERADDVSAPDSWVRLPGPFEIVAPASGTSFSRASDNVVITWEPSGTLDDMSWRVIGGSCADADNLPDIAGDPGVMTLEVGDVVALEGHESESCSITVELTRSRPGTLDPAYGEGGTVYARQVRKIELLSAP